MQRQGARLIGSPQPGLLPGKRDRLKGSPDPGEFAVTVAEFYGLMLGKRDRNRPSYTRVRLKRADLKDVIYGCIATVPVVAINRGPQSRFYVVTQMHFDRAYGSFRQSILALGELAACQVVIVRGEQPNSSIRIQYPIAPPPRETQLRFEAPTIGTRVDQVARIVLARRGYDLNANAQEGLLLPLRKVLR